MVFSITHSLDMGEWLMALGLTSTIFVKLELFKLLKKIFRLKNGA